MKILFIDPAYCHYKESPRIAGPTIIGELLKYEKNIILSAFIDTKLRANPISWNDYHNLESKYIEKTIRLAKDVDVIFATSWTDSSSRLLKILREIKSKYPNKKIVVGGYHFKTLAEQINYSCPLEEYNFIDIISVAQQGTFNIKQILDGLINNDFTKVPGVLYKDKNNKIIFNSYDRFESTKHFGSIEGYKLYADLGLKPEFVMVGSAQGCPWNCYFCVDQQSKYCRLLLDKFAEQLKIIRKIFPKLKQIRFSDPDFTALSIVDINRKLIEDICKLTHKNKLLWSAFTRSDEVDEKLLKLMYDNGCRSLLAGIESIDNKMLENIKKGGKTSQITSENFVDFCIKRGIDARISLLFGAIGETKESAEKNIKFAMAATKKGVYVAIHILEPRISDKYKVLDLARSLGYNWYPEDFDIDLPDHLYPKWALEKSNTIFPALEMHATERVVNHCFSKFPKLVSKLDLPWSTNLTRSEVARYADLCRLKILNLGHPDPGRSSKDDIYLTQKYV